MAPAMLASVVAANRCRAKRLNASEPPASIKPSIAAFVASNEVASGPASHWLMPSSTSNGTTARPNAARVATARPTANAKRESLPVRTRARPRAARHKATTTGVTAAKPELQLNSGGNSSHQPMRAAAALITAAKPATWLARCLFRLLPSPTNSVTLAPDRQGRGAEARGSELTPVGQRFSTYAVAQTWPCLAGILSEQEQPRTAESYPAPACRSAAFAGRGGFHSR